MHLSQTLGDPAFDSFAVKILFELYPRFFFTFWTKQRPVFNAREQMKLRHRLMEIDNHILGLTMEFERQNMIVTQWEMDKAK